MPLPLITPALASVAVGGMNLIGQGINAAAQGSMNRKSRKWSEKMYAQQRKDALEDWDRQNIYNSPSAQMERLKAAGLNPNLVYGHGADAGAVSPVRSSQVEAWRPQAPQIDLGGAGSSMLDAYYSVQMKQQGIDNMATQGEILKREVTLKEIEALAKLTDVDKKNVDIDRGKLKLAIESKLAELGIPIDTALAGLDLTRARKDILLKDYELRAAMNEKNVQLASERVISLKLGRDLTREEIQRVRQVTANLVFAGLISKKQAEMWGSGINPNDPMWARILLEIVNAYFTPQGGKKNNPALNKIMREFPGKNRGATGNW